MAGYFSIPTNAYPTSYTLGVLDKINKRGAYAPATSRTAPATAGPVTGYDPRYGGIPSAPVPGTEALNAILANLKNLSDLSKLTTETGKANAGAARAALLASVPQFDALMNQFQENIGAASRGELSPSLRAQINQNLAEAGLASGSPGGPAADAARMRAMGLTSEEVQRRALQDMATMTGLAPTGVPVDASKMQIDPTTQLIWQWLANQLASAPIPGAAREDELRRQLEGIRAGIAAGTMPYGQAAGITPSKQQDLSWLKDIINRSPATSGGANVPRGTTTGTANVSSRTEEDIINQYLDEIAPVNWPGGDYFSDTGGGAYDRFLPTNDWLQNTNSSPYSWTDVPANTFYNPWEDEMTSNPLNVMGWANTGYTPAVENNLPEDYFAFPEWY